MHLLTYYITINNISFAVKRGIVLDIKSKLEIAYYISGILLAVVGLIGLSQLWFARHEAKVRFKRISVDNSIKVIERYYAFVTLYDKFVSEREDKGIPLYKGTIQQPEIAIDSQAEYKRTDQGFHIILNELEIICASIMSGSCDEKFIFNSIGKTLLGTIAHEYDLLIWCRNEDEPCNYYNNIYNLFKIWRTRYIKLEMLNEKQILDNQIASIKDKKIKEIV